MSAEESSADEFQLAITSGDYLAAIEALRNTRSNGMVTLEPGLSAEQIDRIIDASSPGEALYLLGSAVWSFDGYELLGLNILLEADVHGSADADSAIGEGLAWLGMPERAVEWLEKAWSRATGEQQTRLGGLLAESLQAVGEHSERVLTLLEYATEADESFGVAFAAELCEVGDFERARDCLENLVVRDVYGAAIALGNLLVDQLDDPVGAQRAYRAGIEQGDGHSAYNLGVLLQKEDRFLEAERAFMKARQLGDYTEPPRYH